MASASVTKKRRRDEDEDRIQYRRVIAHSDPKEVAPLHVLIPTAKVLVFPLFLWRETGNLLNIMAHAELERLDVIRRARVGLDLQHSDQLSITINPTKIQALERYCNDDVVKRLRDIYLSLVFYIKYENIRLKLREGLLDDVDRAFAESYPPLPNKSNPSSTPPTNQTPMEQAINEFTEKERWIYKKESTNCAGFISAVEKLVRGEGDGKGKRKENRVSIEAHVDKIMAPHQAGDLGKAVISWLEKVQAVVTKMESIMER